MLSSAFVSNVSHMSKVKSFFSHVEWYQVIPNSDLKPDKAAWMRVVYVSGVAPRTHARLRWWQRHMTWRHLIWLWFVKKTFKILYSLDISSRLIGRSPAEIFAAKRFYISGGALTLRGGGKSLNSTATKKQNFFCGFPLGSTSKKSCTVLAKETFFYDVYPTPLFLEIIG